MQSETRLSVTFDLLSDAGAKFVSIKAYCHLLL